MENAIVVSVCTRARHECETARALTLTGDLDDKVRDSETIGTSVDEPIALPNSRDENIAIRFQKTKKYAVEPSPNVETRDLER